MRLSRIVVSLFHHSTPCHFGLASHCLRRCHHNAAMPATTSTATATAACIARARASWDVRARYAPSASACMSDARAWAAATLPACVCERCRFRARADAPRAFCIASARACASASRRAVGGAGVRHVPPVIARAAPDSCGPAEHTRHARTRALYVHSGFKLRTTQRGRAPL